MQSSENDQPASSSTDARLQSTPWFEAFANALAELASLAPSLDAIDKDLTSVDELEKSLLAQRIAADRPVFQKRKIIAKN